MANGNGNGKKNGNGTKMTSESCYGCSLSRGHCACAHLVLSNFLFGLGLLALLFAWIADADGRMVLGFSSNHLFHDAIVFMIAAVFFRHRI